ncbi:hypothetical protein DFH94DRAFT_684747 [Russula ochroleuca]|uniref:Uncharacterized protein n=1 Tax=Russula ochroleuca TaxID=152965 RepID=A0A9P5K000_9AGAM|nr:hypothetical protein DFH94DRAFT_686936 [Russula ochroleuca]KAF8471584.1 hypothetical protein DFH94DRAFT_684747 [Russula ochroleuca]
MARSMAQLAEVRHVCVVPYSIKTCTSSQVWGGSLSRERMSAQYPGLWVSKGKEGAPTPDGSQDLLKGLYEINKGKQLKETFRVGLSPSTKERTQTKVNKHTTISRIIAIKWLWRQHASMNKKELMRFIRGREDSRQRHLGLKLRHDARRIQVPMGVSNWGHLQAASPPNSALIRTRAPPRNFNSILTRFSTAEGGALFLPRPALFPTKDTQHAHPTHAPPLRFRSGRGGDRMTKSDQRIREAQRDFGCEPASTKSKQSTLRGREMTREEGPGELARLCVQLPPALA